MHKKRATVRLNHREISHEEQIAKNPNEIVSLLLPSSSSNFSLFHCSRFLSCPCLYFFDTNGFHASTSIAVWVAASGSCFDSTGDVCASSSSLFLFFFFWISSVNRGEARGDRARERERERERDSLAPEARMICGTSVCIVSD